MTSPDNEDAPSASGASRSTGVPTQPILRQRNTTSNLTRSATFHSPPVLSPSNTFPPNLPPRSASQTPPLSRRRSSFLSNFSELDDGGNPKVEAPHEEQGSYWHHAPLMFAVVPMVAGLLFQNGSAFATDVLLLGLAAVFLNWSVTVPWEWYHSAQEVLREEDQGMDLDDPLASSTIIEEDESELEEGAPGESKAPGDKDKSASGPGREAQAEPQQQKTPEQKAAIDELRRQETYAQILCFVGPVLGAYLLHTIREQLTRPSEGLVSNYNLTLFVLAAELRPTLHAIKLIRARTLHLQRLAASGGPSSTIPAPTELAELKRRLDELEDRGIAAEAEIENKGKEKEQDTKDPVEDVKAAFQPQLDALTRALRRYEKRTATQVIQTEARLQQIEGRLRDALALAAAAVRKDQIARSRKGSTGVVGQTVDFVGWLVWWPVGTGLKIVQWPFAMARKVLLGKKEKKRRPGVQRSRATAVRRA